MQRKKVIVIGGSGHAKVVIDTLQAMNIYEITGFTSPIFEEQTLCGAAYLGNDHVIPTLNEQGITGFIVAIGDNTLREKLFIKCVKLGMTPINAISPSSYISPHAVIGAGVLIAPGATINAGTVVKDNVIINTLAGIDHDCIISSHVHIAPGATLTGNVKVDVGAMVGAKSTVIPKINIGEWSTVGAGATVIENVVSYSTVVGVPAKKIKQKDDI